MRVDLASETMHKAYDVAWTFVAEFTWETTRQAVVLFSDWPRGGEDDGRKRNALTCRELGLELRKWFSLIGDVPVRLDMGFETNGLCYDLDAINVGQFPNENNLLACVLYPKSAKPVIQVSATTAGVN